jgi:hypothetical protein
MIIEGNKREVAMAELTLESLAKRLEEVESELVRLKQPEKDWKRSFGMFRGSEFMKQVDAEIEAIREAELAAVREGREE